MALDAFFGAKNCARSDNGHVSVGRLTTEDHLSTKGSTGKLVLHILGAIAQFERSLMLERTRAGLAAVRARGKVPKRATRWRASSSIVSAEV
jgi:DNA invertase Pin-like site-specific DNA recombinase